jgi:hypothetical protein
VLKQLTPGVNVIIFFFYSTGSEGIATQSVSVNVFLGSLIFVCKTSLFTLWVVYCFNDKY